MRKSKKANKQMAGALHKMAEHAMLPRRQLRKLLSSKSARHLYFESQRLTGRPMDEQKLSIVASSWDQAKQEHVGKLENIVKLTKTEAVLEPSTYTIMKLDRRTLEQPNVKPLWIVHDHNGRSVFPTRTAALEKVGLV